jgi:UDP-N-acetylmuramoyl-tripeptide--D-alanyl-D-alanine ligase
MTAQWGAINAGEIASTVRGEMAGGSAGVVFSGLSSDSRAIKVGELFWALKGEKFDGHDFLKDAINKGATGIVVEKGRVRHIPAERDIVTIAVADTLRALGDLASWWRHEHKAAVVGITGSAGKTTTKEMAAAIFGLSGMTLKNKGNFNNLIGLPLSLFLLDASHRTAVLEMGMNRPGEIGRLTEIADPDVGLITNVARAHVEGVGSLEGVAKAKVELLEKMSSGRKALLNGDDELLMRTAAPLRRKVMTFGLGPKNDVSPDGVKNLGRKGFAFQIRYAGEKVPVVLGTPGVQNIYNALAASAIAFALNEPVDRIAEGLNRFEGIPGRFTLSPLPDGCTLVDDTYNANPHSLKAAMDSLSSLVNGGGRIVVGLGDMLELGNETAAAHVEAGERVAAVGAHGFVALGEQAHLMIQGAVDKGFPPQRAVIAKDHQDMAGKIRGMIRKGDLVFLKGSRRVGLEKVAALLKAE